MRSRLTRFRIDPERSWVVVEGESSVHSIQGRATGVEGTIEVAFARGHPVLTTAPRAHVELGIDRIGSGNPLQDAEMRRRVDARRHPTIVGDLDRVEASGDGTYRVWGDLTFHGSTRRVEAEVRVDVHAQRTLVAEWHQVIDIREFDVNPPRILMLRVHPEVRVTVHLEAESESDTLKRPNGGVG
jgi:polyisoprenoid-binding protein YceI